MRAGGSGQTIVLTAYQATASATPTSSAPATAVDLCVGVAPLQQSNVRGQASQWVVGAWTTGGNVPDAKIQLQSSAGAGLPVFSFGCGSGNGTSVCDLGALDASSAQRQLQAEVTVPLTATTVTSVGLTVTGGAANLATDPAAAASVVVLSAASAVAANLPLSTTPGVTAPIPTVSPGGSAAGLFPTVGPGGTGASPVANVSPIGGSSLGSEVAEGAGVAALGVAMLLAITRLSFRRPAPRHAANSTVAAAPPPPVPAERQEQPN
jgi:hypothetical protein